MVLMKTENATGTKPFCIWATLKPKAKPKPADPLRHPRSGLHRPAFELLCQAVALLQVQVLGIRPVSKVVISANRGTPI